MSFIPTTARDEVLEALANVNHEAKRAPHVFGWTGMPSRWDKLHARLDDLLDMLDQIDNEEAKAC